MSTRMKLFAILFCVSCVAIAQTASDLDSLAAQIEAANETGRANIALTADITLTEPLPAINASLTIAGNGYTISGDARFRLFDVIGGSLTIQNLALADGYSDQSGGAIRVQNDARLLARNVSFLNNRARWGGAISTMRFRGSGDINNSAFFNNSAGMSGGAVFWNGGTLHIRESVFMENDADSWGGAIEALSGKANIQNSAFAGNTAGVAGGILASGATTTMTHLTLVDNHARWSEGNAVAAFAGEAALRNSIVAGGAGLDCAGAIDLRGNISGDGTCALLATSDLWLGELTGSPGYFPLLDGSPAIDAGDGSFCLPADQIGTARPQGAGCDAGAIEALDATPPEATPIPTTCQLRDHILAANTNRAVGACPAGASHDIIVLSQDITLSEPLPLINATITIEGNGHTIDGSRRFPIFIVEGRKLTVNNLRLINGRAEGFGGAILARNDAEVVVNNARFEHNEALSIDAGDQVVGGGFGGAIGALGLSATITVNNSVFENNHAGLFGGAIYMSGGTLTTRGSAFINNHVGSFGGAIDIRGGRASIENSTFKWNNAGYGGAIAVNGGSVSMTHLTMLENRSSRQEGNAIAHYGGTANLRNSITFDGGSAAMECHGNVNARGNFSEDGSCGSEKAGYPKLDKMTGDPPYSPPQNDSPVVDTADDAHCLPTDQLGNARPEGDACDIGAVELGVSPPSQAAAADADEYADCAATTTAGLNVRDRPGGQRIGGVAQGESLPVLARTDEWLQVRWRGATGWISADWAQSSGKCL